MTRFTSIFILVLISIQSVLGVPMDHLMACHEGLPADKKHLSPVYGMVLLDSPVLANLRFYGQYGSENSAKDAVPYKRYDQLTRLKDHGLTATAALIQYLFPSPTDVLAITGRQSFMYKNLQMSGLAELVTVLDGFCDIENGTSKLEQFLRGKIPGKATRKGFAKDFPVYASMLIDAVKESRTNPYSFSPYFIQELITAYAFELSRRSPQHDFGDFMETLSPGAKVNSHKYHPLTKEGYFAWKDQLLAQAVVSPEQMTKLIEDPLLTYQISRAMDQYEALSLEIPYGSAIVDGIEFSDCCESGLRSLILFLLYDHETNTLDFSRIPATAVPEFREFFEDYDPRQLEKYHSKWAILLANLKDPLINYKKGNEKTRCEVGSGIPNCLRVLAEVLGEPKLIDESLSTLERIKTLESLFSKGQKRYEVLNEDDFKEEGEVKEIQLGTFDFEFTFISNPGHTGTDYNNSKATLRPAFSRAALIQLTSVYIPLYANLVPRLLSINSPNYWEESNRDYEFMQKRQALFSGLEQPTIYRLLLAESLHPTESKTAFIELVMGSDFLELNRQLPALNHRIALCDAHSNIQILKAVVGKNSETTFPGLLNRIRKMIHERPFDHLECLTFGGSYLMDEYKECIDLCFEQSILDRMKEITTNSNNLEPLSFIIKNYGNAHRLSHYLDIILELFSSKIPELIRLQYPSEEVDGVVLYPSFAANVLGFTGANQEQAKRLLDLLSDDEFENMCYEVSKRFSTDENGETEIVTANPVIIMLRSAYQESIKNLKYALERLIRINPKRLKDSKTNEGTILNTLVRTYQNDFTREICQILIPAFHDDPEWIMRRDFQGKSIIDRFIEGNSLDLVIDIASESNGILDLIQDSDVFAKIIPHALVSNRFVTFSKTVDVAKKNAPETFGNPVLMDGLKNMWRQDFSPTHEVVAQVLELIELIDKKLYERDKIRSLFRPLIESTSKMDDYESSLLLLSNWLTNHSVGKKYCDHQDNRPYSTNVEATIARYVARKLDGSEQDMRWQSAFPLLSGYLYNWTYDELKNFKQNNQLAVQRIITGLSRVSNIEGAHVSSSEALYNMVRRIENCLNQKELMHTFLTWYFTDPSSQNYRSTNGENAMLFLVITDFLSKNMRDERFMPYLPLILVEYLTVHKNGLESLLPPGDREIYQICLNIPLESFAGIIESNSTEIQTKAILVLRSTNRLLGFYDMYSQYSELIVRTLCQHVIRADVSLYGFNKYLKRFCKTSPQLFETILQQYVYYPKLRLAYFLLNKKFMSFSDVQDKDFWVKHVENKNEGWQQIDKWIHG